MQITSNKFRLRVIEQLISIMQMARPENGRHTLGPGYLFIVVFTTQGVRGGGLSVRAHYSSGRTTIPK